MYANILTDSKIKSLKPRENRYRAFDGNGLYIRINPSGAKTWYVRFRREKKLFERKIGEYPAMPLQQARKIRDDVKARIILDLPDEDYLTFREVANNWYKVKTGARKYADKYLRTIQYRLQHYIFPYIGDVHIKKLKRGSVMLFLEELASKGKVETARSCAEIIQQVFEYALNHEIVERNPAAGVAKSMPTSKKKSFTSVKNPEELGRLIARIYTLESRVVRAALLLIAYCFTRCGETLAARWSEIDLERRLWTIPAEHTKLKREHLVPLPHQVVSILKDLLEYEKRSIYKGRDMRNRLIFPTFQPRKGRSESAVTEAALLKALKDIASQPKRKGEVVPRSTVHGFRHTASTLLHEQGFNSLAIEMQLAHLDPNRIRSVYNSYDFLKERREMLQKYADYLDTLRTTKAG